MKYNSLNKGVLACWAMAMLLLSGNVAEGAGGVSGTTTVTVQNIIGIGAGNPLAFGHIVAGSTSGTVIVNPATGARSGTGGVLLVGSAFGAAAFNVYGSGNKKAYNVTLPNNNAVTISNGSQTMRVTNFTSSGVNSLDSNYQDSFTVGATLQVGANQAAGLYTGSYSVTVAFN